MTRLPMTLAMLAAATALNVGPALGQDDAARTNPRVKISTTLGDIVLELNIELAPITVYNFLRYTQDKYYDGTVFHRVMSNFMIQGGGYTPEMDKKASGVRPQIRNEWKNGLKNMTGTISMARLGGNPDSATSEFFINVVDNGRLDRPQPDGAAYCVFGKVVEGMDTVEKIRKTEVGVNAKYGRNKVVPKEPVVITSATVLDGYDLATAQAAAEQAEQQFVQQTQAAKQAKVDELAQAIASIEKEAGKKMTTTDSGLKYVDLVEGDGDTPPSSSTRVTVHYRGTLLDGTEFDSSYKRDKPATFALNGVIKGWTEGVGSMKVGGKRKLVIPANLAYGKRGSPPKIGPGVTLIFVVELLSME